MLLLALSSSKLIAAAMAKKELFPGCSAAARVFGPVVANGCGHGASRGMK